MSKLHVKQIEGYITAQLSNKIDMKDYAHHSDESQKKKAFLTRGLAALAVSNLAEIPVAELGAHITDGQGDGGIDLIYFDSTDKTLYLVQTKWHEDGHGSIDLGETLKFINGVKKVLDNDLDDLNPKVKAKQAEIESAIFDANSKFILVLAHTGQEDLSSDVRKEINRYIDAQNDTSELMSARVLTQVELHKAVAAGLAGAPISEEVQLSNWGQTRDPHYAIYGRVCASDIAQWMHSYGNRLFDRNLRQFLGGSIVNQDIVNTLLERPADFWYFNNGITAIASTVKKKPIGGNSTDSGIFECSGFCVVNGAQTVGSIHSASLQLPDEVAKASVPVRIISLENSGASFPSEVTRYTNTQNAIEKRDFIALDPEQERIRQELHIEGVEYVYRAGSATSINNKRFDLAEATVALACSNPDVSMAVQAKREIGKLWEDIKKAPYKQLFNSGVSGPYIWESVQTLRAIEAQLHSQQKSHSGRESLICIHGNRFIQWAAMRRLGLKPGAAFSDVSKDVPEAVAKTISEVIEIIKVDYFDSYPASLFKNLAKCRSIAKGLSAP